MIELISFWIIQFGLIFIAMYFVYFGILIDRWLHDKYRWASGSFYKPAGLGVFIGFIFVNAIIFGWI